VYGISEALKGQRMVYFIEGDRTGLIKIGSATNVKKRLRTLQACSPDILTLLAIIPDAPDDAPYHFQFRDDWAGHGEWFRASTKLKTFIQTLPLVAAETRCAIRNNNLKIPRPFRPSQPKDDRAELAKHVLEGVHAARPGSSAQKDFMRLYAKLRGWKSWREVPEFQKPAVYSTHTAKK
jgi:hypothetical protein